MPEEKYRLPIPLDLQLFEGEKTEEPTSRRITKAREQGQIAKSQELNSALVLLACFSTLGIFGSYIYHQMAGLTQYVLGNLSQGDFTVSSLKKVYIEVTLTGAKALAPIVAVAMATGLAANYLQVGVLFSTEALTVKLDRLNPINGFKRLFSAHSLVELVKSVFKVLIVGIVIYRVIKDNFDIFPKMLDMDITASATFIGNLAVKIGLESGVLILVLAAADLWFQKWSFHKSLKMSKQEIKEEFKQTEGNPQIKGKIREKMRRMSMRRMMQEIPKADVVITNPTHYAVALRYDGATMTAPQIVAKGQDHLALRIKEIAREHNVATVENKPLAQALFKGTEIGDHVPPELFQAVAEVLAFVYRLKGKVRK